ncbi:MAG TPA: Fur family transcriptional regulator [Candidatus Competibacteraceae bacterium]|nr:Fur family transcriptional regulator [Candidatus Competibacteraceae bacterium]
MVKIRSYRHLLPRYEARKLLEQAGILPTQQRLDIACVMLARPQHVSADQLLAMVNQEGGNVSKATVYNTLRLFASKGIIREVLVDPTRVFYDSNTTEHHHLYNEDTGTLTDLSPTTLQVGQLPALPNDMMLSGVDIIVRVRNSASKT